MSLNTAKTPPKEFTLDLGEVDIRQRWQTRPPKQFPSPWACEWGFDEYGLWQCFQVKGVKHKMRYIPPGEFWMGSPEDEPNRESKETLHHVTLKEGFWLGETTVTQELWLAVMGSNPSEFTAPNNELLPVDSVSWNDCQDFMRKLKGINSLFNLTFPTEIQWEYSCRAGTTRPLNIDDQLITAQKENYVGHEEYFSNLTLGVVSKNVQEHRQGTVDVNTHRANAWGLKQMHGNVLEWCFNSHRELLALQEREPRGGSSAEYQALRGYSMFSSSGKMRSMYRVFRKRGYGSSYFGLRLAGY